MTVITGVMFSDQLSSMPVAPVAGVGELERPDTGDPQGRISGFCMSTVWPSRLESELVG